MCNYRKKYKQYYGIEFGSEYIVHHIDENRNNNSIDNLLLLPRVLHSKYHQYKREVQMQQQYLRNVSLKEPNILLADYTYGVLGKFIKVCKECQEWIAYKERLDYSIYLRKYNNEE